MLNQNILKKYSIVTSNEPSSSIATPTTTINTYPANSYNGCEKKFSRKFALDKHKTGVHKNLST
ncbi:18027_t:CDS:2 [Entrophospora sp. SA101]|nr:18027_t:CDS:2 [Entrophospora sp. SA101]